MTDPERPYEPSPVTGATDAPITAGEVMLYLFGWISLLAGLFFLLVSPNIKPASTEYAITGPPPEVVNLHKMFLGETFTIAGAVFLAAAWRPR